MSLLSISEALYVGEESSGAKPTEDMLEDPSLLRVDCPCAKAADKLSDSLCDRKQTLIEVDFSQQEPNGYQLNGGNDDNLRELSSSPQERIHKILDGVHVFKMPPSNNEYFQQVKQDEQVRSEHEGNTLMGDIDSDGSKVFNGILDEETTFCEEVKYNEEIMCLTTEPHSPSDSQSGKIGGFYQQEKGVKTANGSCKSIDSALPALNTFSREETNEGRDIVDVQDDEVSTQTDTSDSHGQNHDQSSTFHELPDFARRNDIEQDKFYIQGKDNKILSSCNSSYMAFQKIDSTVPDRNQGRELCVLEGENSEQDHAVALWVKWRGKWQTGIQCPRADCPSSTLKAKPTHERKRYTIVFFPRNRTYYWVDMLLVRPIEELPVPLANGTHRKWRKLVKDLTVPRHYVMQKLAIAMLNFSDLLHTKAVMEDARKATTWKEFALEASRCSGYIDLGKMLIKLQKMILPGYIDGHWLQASFNLWVQRCENAQNAESIEILTEELMQSVLWKKVEELWNAPVQPELGPEWKTWKQEVMKWFHTSHPIASGGVEQSNCDSAASVVPHVSRKRPKLDFHRAETCVLETGDLSCRTTSSQDDSRNAISGNFDCQENLESTSTCEPCKVEVLPGPSEAPQSHSLSDRWNEVTYEGKDNRFIQNYTESGSVKTTPYNAQIVSGNKYRQCAAFIEAKGRQCGRWANDGDIYCCVHLNMHSVEKLSQEERDFPAEAQMCEGLTTHGRKCKHRARYGSSFCKKHRLQTNHDLFKTDSLDRTSESLLKREDSENKVLENFSSLNTIYSKDFGLTGNMEAPMQENLIQIVVEETLDERNCLMNKSELYNALPTPVKSISLDWPRCIGYYRQKDGDECQEYAKRHTLYCEKHVPKFLKRARNGKSRLISKDIFLNLLQSCSSRKEKINLHQACDLLYGFMKGSLSRQHSFLKADNMGWILAEASKDPAVGEYLIKLVSSEREKLIQIWGFDADKSKQAPSLEAKGLSTFVVKEKENDLASGLKCKICFQEFSNYQNLGQHWSDVHKREARWLFRGYACAVCMDSFTNRKVLEGHVQERHGVQFLQHSTIFRCMSCNSHFISPEQLWQHVLSSHTAEFKLSDYTQHPLDQALQPIVETINKPFHSNHISEKDDGSQKFTCRFCGLRFDLLPDLGRHHQVAHMRPGSVSHFPPRRGNYQLNRSRHCYPKFKKSFRPSFRFKKQNSFVMQKHFRSSDLVLSMRSRPQQLASETAGLGWLLDSCCSDLAQTLFSKIQKSKSRPSNLEILSIARATCCRLSLHSSLEAKYGVLPENLYLKAAKVCSELNVQIDWHQEGFVCPKGCKPPTNPLVAPLDPLSDRLLELPAPIMDPPNDARWEMDEYHYVLDSKHFNWKPKRAAVLLCEDISFGRERIPIPCLVDDDIKDALHIHFDEVFPSQGQAISMPWQGFTYVTERLMVPSLSLDTKNSQLGCACSHAQCCPENCDHVYLFDSDYEKAEDIYGKPMHGRFAYDDRGQIILEEGYLVYECNSLCNCDTSCQNRVLQKGVQVKLEIFRTIKKDWAVRSGEAISRGTFVCEYVGEVLNYDELGKGRGRRDNNECSYLYDIDAHIDRARGLSEGTVPYVLDASKYGNVSRFINHSCSPNLVNYLVLVESMDCQLAHIGFYASRDIAMGEELTYDYRYKLLPGDGHPCLCGAANCRGRLY
ncbi:histone-lysine N-methyltransferase SUVR5 isoform X1 [Typha angustifolia]|uniref:histone-lysine N-methyltransferase SUVR5 isoform X1 n=1 Tax=Typha angustifolia TaxID=59011 RepID=UPI003C2F01F1